MRRLLLIAFLAAMCLGVGFLFLACSSGGGGDDDNAEGDDTGADDDSTADDDNAEGDDTGDDDTSDDDIGDLTWQDPPSSDLLTWFEAKAYCDNLSFNGHDDWRLPTISELRSLIRDCDATVPGGACGVTDDCLDLSCWTGLCKGCDELAGPGSGGAYWPDGMSGDISWYWSLSQVPPDGIYAWSVGFSYGWVDYGNVYSYDAAFFYARCVR